MKYHSSEEDFIDAHYNDTWLTVEQVAQQLSCSQRKVYNMIENKDILNFKFGGARRISKISLNKYIYESPSN